MENEKITTHITKMIVPLCLLGILSLASSFKVNVTKFDQEKPISTCDASSIITRHEGSRKCVYVDTTGHKTIGVGFNLDAPGARTVIES